MDHKTLSDIYYSHIPSEKKFMPNSYWDNIPEISIGKAYSDAGLTNGRDINRDDYFRIGDTIFSIPPEQFSITKESTKRSIPKLRQRDKAALKTGFNKRTIVVKIKFNGLHQINGLRIPGPNGDQYIDGLRSLIAQVQLTPFLPVENYVLNTIHDIHVVYVKQIAVAPVSEIPGLLECSLTLAEFNSQPLTTLPDEAFTDIINWDVFRWYYQRKVEKLIPVPSINVLDEFTLGIIDEGILSNQQTEEGVEADRNDPEVIDKNIKNIYLTDDLHMTAISIGMGSAFKDIQMSDYAKETTQYFGNTSKVIACTFETTNEDNVIAITSLQETADRYAREYKYMTAQGFVRLDNPLSRLFGIEYVIIDRVNINTVDGVPGLYRVDMYLTSYNKTQVESAMAQGISPLKDGGTISDLLSNNVKHSYRESKYNAIIENTLNSLDLYPDLDLPTYNEYVNAVNNINQFRTNNNLSEIGYNKNKKEDEFRIITWYDNAWTLNDINLKDYKVDPDFYFNYPSLEQTGLDVLINDNDTLNNLSEKIDAYLTNAGNGVYAKVAPITRPKATYYEKLDENNREGGNPSYAEIVNYIIEVSEEKGVPTQLALATAWTESWMTHYTTSGDIYHSHNKDKYGNITSTDWGIFQINDRWHPKAFEDDINVKNDWKTNVEYGIKQLKWLMGLAIDKNEGILGPQVFPDRTPEICIASATYSGYNAGYKWTWRYRTKKIDAEVTSIYDALTKDGYDARDNNYYNHYINSPWSEFVKEIIEETAIEEDFCSPIAGTSFERLRELGEISSKFGMRFHPKHKRYIMHNGVDLAVGTGTSLVSIKSGKVTKMVDNYSSTTGWGAYIKIEHIDGTAALYGHLSKIFVEVGQFIKQGQLIAFSGESGGVTGAHLHLEIFTNGKNVDPENYMIGDNGFAFTELDSGMLAKAQVAEEQTTVTPKTNIKLIGGKQVYNQPQIDFHNLGKPLKRLIGGAFVNSREGLIERMLVDYMEYNRRGTMNRAFPSFAILFVDEGMWMDGRRLWSNYYLYNSIVDISIEKHRNKPADTAVVNFSNIYNSLGVNSKVIKKDDSVYRSLIESLHIYTDEVLNDIIDNKNDLLTTFNVKAGSRLHIRMGYGNSASKMPITFNGTITEINTDEIVTVIAQSDGMELTSHPIGTTEEDSTGWWDIGAEPHRILTYLLTERSSPFLARWSDGIFGETSKYGIEHFGNFYFGKENKAEHELFTELMKHKNKAATLQDKILFDVFFNPYREPVSVKLGRTMLEFVLPSGSALEEQLRSTQVEYYDIMKNIYIADLELAKTNSGDDKSKAWWLYNPETTTRLYTFNKTPWDLMKILAGITPEFICHPHNHEFRSTLFFGLPHWNVRYKYEYVNSDEVYEYAKPYSQAHILSSTYDIINNMITAKAPDITMASANFSGPNGEMQTTETLYADRYIKNELQKHRIIDSGTMWAVTGVDVIDSIIDTDLIHGVVDFFKDENLGEESARRTAVAAIQNSFKEMYTGSLLILGDTSIKPYDTIYINDNFVNMHGGAEVRQVIHHMGISTGFVSEITPDMAVAQVEVEAEKMYIHRALAGISTGIIVAWRKAYFAGRVLKATKNAIGIADKGVSKVKNWSITKSINSKITPDKIAKHKRALKQLKTSAKNIRYVKEVAKNKKVIKAGKMTMTGVRSIANTAKAIRAGLLVPSATGIGVVVTIIGLIVFELLWKMFYSIYEYFRDGNVIKIYPLWYDNLPYVSGINGHKKLIPGYTDEMLSLNYKSTMNYEELDEFNKSLTNIPTDIQERILEEYEGGQTLDQQQSYTIKRNLILRHGVYPYTKDGKEDLKMADDVLAKDIDTSNPRIVKPVKNTKINTGSPTYRPLSYTNMEIDDDNGYKIGKFKVVGTQPVFAFADGEVVAVIIGENYETIEKDEGLLESIINTTSRSTAAIADDAERLFLGKEIYHSTVVIKHTNINHEGESEFYTLYHNLVTFNFTKGDIVKGGQCLGTSGIDVWTELVAGDPMLTTMNKMIFMIIGSGNDRKVYDPSVWIDEDSGLGTWDTLIHEWELD